MRRSYISLYDRRGGPGDRPSLPSSSEWWTSDTGKIRSDRRSSSSSVVKDLSDEQRGMIRDCIVCLESLRFFDLLRFYLRYSGIFLVMEEV